jgi:hypothetical protein
MLIKPPIDPRNAVREDVVLIRLIPLQYVAHPYRIFLDLRAQKGHRNVKAALLVASTIVRTTVA